MTTPSPMTSWMCFSTESPPRQLIMVPVAVSWCSHDSVHRHGITPYNGHGVRVFQSKTLTADIQNFSNVMTSSVSDGWSRGRVRVRVRVRVIG